MIVIVIMVRNSLRAEAREHERTRERENESIENQRLVCAGQGVRRSSSALRPRVRAFGRSGVRASGGLGRTRTDGVSGNERRTTNNVQRLIPRPPSRSAQPMGAPRLARVTTVHERDLSVSNPTQESVLRIGALTATRTVSVSVRRHLRQAEPRLTLGPSVHT